MRRAQALHQGLVVGVEFEQHVCAAHKFLVVVGNTLQLGDVADGTNRCAADLAHPLGDIVGDVENLVALLDRAADDNRGNEDRSCANGSFWFLVKREDIGQQTHSTRSIDSSPARDRIHQGHLLWQLLNQDEYVWTCRNSSAGADFPMYRLIPHAYTLMPTSDKRSAEERGDLVIAGRGRIDSPT